MTVRVFVVARTSRLRLWLPVVAAVVLAAALVLAMPSRPVVEDDAPPASVHAP